MTPTQQRQRLRAILAGNQCLSPASVYDAMSARIAQSVGYELGMLAGSVASNTTLAAPDIIVLTLTEFADQVRRIMRALTLSLMTDADHGYGNAMNVMRTVEELEHSGVVVLAVVALLWSNQVLKRNTGQIYETESAYNYIQVAEQNGYTILKLTEGQGVHSIYKADTLQYNGPWDQFLAGPYFYTNRKPSDIKRIAIIGLAAGTAARQMTAVYGSVPIDGFELVPKIVEVGQKYFGMNEPNLNIHIGDGRLGLEQSPYKYDIIAVDAYRPPYIPAHMTTQEFFEIVASHLTEDGVLVLNSASIPGDRRLINGLATTIGTVFPSIYTVDIPDAGTKSVASANPDRRTQTARDLLFAKRGFLIHNCHPIWCRPVRNLIHRSFAHLRAAHSRDLDANS